MLNPAGKFSLTVAVAVCAMALPGVANAGFIVDTLGAAGPSNYAILALSGVTDFALNGPGTTFGNVGYNGTHQVALNASNNGPDPNHAIDGNLYLAAGASVNNIAQVNGSVFTNQNLSAAQTAASSAATTFASLSVNTAITSITSTTTINSVVAGGNTVLDLTGGINLGNGEVLTLHGAAGDQFIINIVNNSNFVLNSARVLLTGGITDDDVVFNVTGAGNNISSSGGLNNESVVNGIILAVNSGVAFAPGQVNGELIAGGSTVRSLVSGCIGGATLGQVSCLTVPECCRTVAHRWCSAAVS